MLEWMNADMRNSIYDGIFANVFATLTGGVFLTGFALYLGMNELMIGVLASIPFVVTIFQLPVSLLLSKYDRKKEVSCVAALLARLTWLPILAVAIVPEDLLANKGVLITLLLFLSHSYISASYVSWLSWISELVPDEIRGRFFGTRNMLCGAAGMIVMVFFGKLLDRLNSRAIGALPDGFAITFLSAIVVGLLSLHFLKKVSPSPKGGQDIQEGTFFRELLGIPLREKNFRLFLSYAFAWGFSVYFASPFFTIYFLKDLEYSYGFVAILGVVSGSSDLLFMYIWGWISDKVRNKAVIRFAGWVAVFLPTAWVFVKPGNVLMPVILHLLGGGFWAGINLCTTNLLMGISPRINRTVFFSVYNIFSGLGATLGPLAGGITINAMADMGVHALGVRLLPIQIVFIISTVLRLLSFQLIKYVREPGEVKVGQAIRVLRSIRGLSTVNGFSSPLHTFTPREREEVKD